MKQTKTEIIKDFINAYNSFDINAMIRTLHPEVIFKNIYGGEVTASTSGIKEFEKLAYQSASLFKQREQKIKILKEEGDIVSVEVDYNAILSAGNVINLRGKSEYLFKDGLIFSITDES